MKTYKSSWYEFTPDWSGFSLRYQVAGYFDHRPMLQIYIIWGKLFLYLPWKHYNKIERESTLNEKRADKLKIINNTNYIYKKKYKKEYYDECDPPKYGIYFYMDQLGINYRRKTILYSLPWSLDWIRTSYLKKDGNWEHETKKCKKEFWDQNKWENILYTKKYNYQYIKKDNTLQETIANIQVRETEWRWKWFKWLKYPRKIKKYIEIKFDKEIGEKSGTWKGGVLGCSYTMLKNEKPHETLKRMEKERKL